MPCHKLCKLHKTCKTVCVPATPAVMTDDRKDIMILGEAPGREEDVQGIPFVGRTGQALRDVLKQTGLLDRVVFDNSVRCRPPDNQTPGIPTIRACRPNWVAEIERRKPRVLVLMGATAIKALTGEKSVRINQYRDRKQWEETFGKHKVTVIATYHPAFALRNPGMWKYIVDDLYRILEPDFMAKEHIKVTIVPNLIRKKLPKEMAFDLETTGLNPFLQEARILTVGWSSSMGIGAATTDIAGFVRILEEHPNTTLVGHNVKFDLLWLREKFGYVHKGPIVDTMSMAHLLDENRPAYALTYLSSIYTGTGDYDEGMKAQRSNLSAMDILKVLEYNAKDAAVTWMIYKRMRKEIQAERLQNLVSFSGEVTRALVNLEHRGIPISRHKLMALKRACLRQAQQIEESFTACNLGSPAQVADYLYNHCKLPVLARTASGNPSTNEDTLTDLLLRANKKVRKEIQLILDYRKAKKIAGTYVKNLLENMDAYGRVHPSYRQTGTVTGRLSCANPNFQNLPKDRTGPKQVIRTEPASSLVLVQADYSQVEMRIGAMMSQDPVLLKLLRDGVDLHSETARRLLGREPSPEDRQRAKTINFGIFYGMGPDHLAKTTGMGRGEAQRFIREWFSLYPGVRKWIEEIQSQMLDRGYVESLFGRRRRLPKFVTTVDDQRRAVRQAVNHPVQSSASDLNLMAMSVLSESLRNTREEFAWPIGTVHDSLVFECQKDSLHILVDMIHEIMENPTQLARTYGFNVKFHVPTPVGIEAGLSLGDLKQI